MVVDYAIRGISVLSGVLIFVLSVTVVKWPGLRRNGRNGDVVAWSTKQLADLAGTTVKAIRHYHEIGLLDEPERMTNNYKQYGISHLVRLLRITRLTDLDVPLAQIAVMGQVDAESWQALELLDAELAASIERLHRVRAELALILDRQSSTDLPAGFGPVASNLSTADRALILIYSQVFGPAEMQDLSRLLVGMSGDPIHEQFDALTVDADEPTRQWLAEQYVPHYRTITNRYPWLRHLGSRAPRGGPFAASTVNRAIEDLYNPAQLDVVRRMNELLDAETVL